MLIAHKIALDPTNKQATHFARAAGTARFAYNWALAEWQRQYAAGKKPFDASLRKQLNAVKREQFPWMLGVSKCVVQEAIIDLGASFQRFFNDLRKSGRKSGYPRFKSKSGKASFCAANESGTFRTDGKRVKLPKVGWVRMLEAVRFDGPLKRITVSKIAGRWFASILVETEIQPDVQPFGAVGIDLGIKYFAVLSDGTKFKGPKSHKAELQRMRRLNKSLSRKQKKSSNWKKARAKLARLHAKIANIRKDPLHKASTHIVRTFKVIGIEDLNVSGMSKNRHLARSIMDQGFSKFRSMLEYKARMYGARVVVADKWFPSSKTCSCCGSIKDKLKLSERTFVCEDCGTTIDRDVNAAKNLRNMAASSAVTACGDTGSGVRRKPRAKPASTKQESNSKLPADSYA